MPKIRDPEQYLNEAIKALELAANAVFTHGDCNLKDSIYVKYEAERVRRLKASITGEREFIGLILPEDNHGCTCVRSHVDECPIHRRGVGTS